MMTRTVSPARLILLLVVLGVGCAGDVESLDRAMSELVEGVPQSLLVPVKDTQICPSASACAPASHEHRIDRSLQPDGSARRERVGDRVEIVGTIRVVCLEAEHDEVLTEEPLSAGYAFRLLSDKSSYLDLRFELGSLRLTADRGSEWRPSRLALHAVD